MSIEQQKFVDSIKSIMKLMKENNISLKQLTEMLEK
jgi:hypothetical protein